MSRDAGPVKGGDSIIAFVDDPTGYKWEIIGSKGKPIPEPIAQACCLALLLQEDCSYACQCTCPAQRHSSRTAPDVLQHPSCFLQLGDWLTPPCARLDSLGRMVSQDTAPEDCKEQLLAGAHS